jgi:hypothetical protein
VEFVLAYAGHYFVAEEFGGGVCHAVHHAAGKQHGQQEQYGENLFHNLQR